jgi:cell division protease FtsH
MSDDEVAGLMVLTKQNNQFLGGGQSTKDYSDQMAHNLDNYIKTMLDTRYKAVIKSLEENREAMEEMTAELLNVEVITGKRVQEIIEKNGGTFYKNEDDEDEEEIDKEKQDEKI